MLFVRIENRINCLLDAEVDDLVTVVGQDDVDEILTDVVHIAFNGRKHHSALGSSAAFLLHERFKKAHGGFHGFGGLQHERKLHLAAAEQFADNLHAFEQDVVDDLERGIFFQSQLQMIFELKFFSVDNMKLELLFDRVAA